MYAPRNGLPTYIHFEKRLQYEFNATNQFSHQLNKVKFDEKLVIKRMYLSVNKWLTQRAGHYVIERKLYIF